MKILEIIAAILLRLFPSKEESFKTDLLAWAREITRRQEERKARRRKS